MAVEKKMQEQWPLNRVSAMTTIDFRVEGAQKYMEGEEYFFLICGWENSQRLYFCGN